VRRVVGRDGRGLVRWERELVAEAAPRGELVCDYLAVRYAT
jgi:hypothetical protein